MKLRRDWYVCGLLAVAIVYQTDAATFTVTSTNATGAGALRAEVVCQAVNTAQNLTVYFSSREVCVEVTGSSSHRWHAILQFSGISYGDVVREVPDAELAVNGNRIEYCRDNLIEWYVNGGGQRLTIDKTTKREIRKRGQFGFY
jgi:hypothetical protein